MSVPVRILEADPLESPASPLASVQAQPVRRAPSTKDFARMLSAPVAAAGALSGGPLSLLGSGALALAGGSGSALSLGGDAGASIAAQAADKDAASLDAVEQIQSEGQSMNLQYLALQEQVEAENRSFSTLSNVLHARHDTAKAAIGNIRA